MNVTLNVRLNVTLKVERNNVEFCYIWLAIRTRSHGTQFSKAREIGSRKHVLHHVVHAKTWTVDCGLDHGLDS